VSRIAPFELAFAGVEAQFEKVREEAASSRIDVTDPMLFVSLPSVQRILKQIESPQLLADNPAAIGEYHMLLYLGFRSWDAGKVVRDVAQLPDCVTERLCAVPSDACYLRFPERWFWAQIDQQAPHEPLDGVFVAQSSDLRQLNALAVLGMRPERGGFSQISVTAAFEDLPAARLVSRTPRFAPTMAGGAAAGFKSLASLGELLLLTQLALAEIAS
jgi:hypothetical protein